MDNRRYRRYFIILDHEDEGFDNKQGKSPKGYTKIEIRNGKGVLSHYVQNLKYFDNAEYIYRGFLIGTRGGKQIYADNGTFIIDENGKGELNWRFDPDNVNGQGDPITDFNVIAIIAEATDEKMRGNGFAAPLVGFIDKEKVEWKHVLAERYRSRELSEKEEEIEELYKEKMQKIQALIEETEEEIEEMEVSKEGMGMEKEERLEEEAKKEGEIKEKEEILQEEIKTEEMQNLKALEEDIEIEEEEENIKIENMREPRGDVKIEEKAPMEENIMPETAEDTQENIEIKKAEAVEENVEAEELKEAEKEMETEKVEEETDSLKANKTGEKEKKKEYEYKYQQSHPYYDKTEYSKMKYYDHSNSNKYYRHYFKMVCSYVKNILKYYNEVKPFEKNIEGCRWWKIDCSQQTLYRNFLPFYGYISNMYYYYYNMHYMTGCSDLIYKYQHYIFGIIEDENGEPVYYLYGIPGRYMLSEQPYEGMTGFVYWHPLEDKEPQKGDYGYWILYIDGKTGNVVIPKNPTPPPR